MYFLYQTVFKRTERAELHAICHRDKFRSPHIRYTGTESKGRQAAVFQPYREENQKEKRIDMTPELQRELKAYIEGKEDHEYLFKSREGINKPISRSMAYKILRAAAEYVNLDDIGTHTLRKTFGYHFYKQTKDVAMLQEIFNHSDQRTTLRYIGINQDAMNNAMKKFKI